MTESATNARVEIGGTAVAFCVAYFPKTLVLDQKAIWASPLHLQTLRSEDRNWLVPFGIGTLGLLAADRDIMRHFGSTPSAHSNELGNYGLAAMIASASSLYLVGSTAKNDHSRETGLLAGEAAVDGVIVGESMSLLFRRARPDAANAGSFRAGGASFPSEHALAAWSIATVIAHEYPGPMTKLLAYGAAAGISLSRVAAREHFPSDVVVGSAFGYLIGKYVYRAHHDPALPGSTTHDYEEVYEEKRPARVRPPAQLASPSVPLDSWVYAAFDRLAGLGYAPSAYADLRPWTRMECARIILAAGEDLGVDDNRNSEAYRLYLALETEFSNELGLWGGSGTSDVGIDSLYTRYLGITGTPLDDGITLARL